MSDPSLAALIGHAAHYGVEGVYETAERHLDEPELRRLRIELDALERSRRNGHYRIGRRRRRSHAEQVEAARMLVGEGMTASEVAVKLGVTTRYVRRLLRAPERPSRMSAGPTRPGGRTTSLGHTAGAAR
jgi:hypothetical protein